MYVQNVDPSASLPLLRSLRPTLLENDSVLPGAPVFEWLSVFEPYAELATNSSSVDELSKDDFDQALQAFLSDPRFARFQDDIVFDADGSGSIAITRAVTTLIRDVETSTEEVEAMQSLTADANALAKDFDKQGEVWAYSFGFPFWYQYEIIPTEAASNIGWTLLAVFLVVLLFIAHPGIAVIVTLVVGVVLLDILGIMHFWDVNLNGVSVINLVLSIGLSVDYSVHVAHAFM